MRRSNSDASCILPSPRDTLDPRPTKHVQCQPDSARLHANSRVYSQSPFQDPKGWIIDPATRFKPTQGQMTEIAAVLGPSEGGDYVRCRWGNQQVFQTGARPIDSARSRPEPVEGRLAALGFRRSAFGWRLSAVGFRLSAFGPRLSAFGFRLSAFGFRLSADDGLDRTLRGSTMKIGSQRFFFETLPFQ
jgi:hypothetical protein